VLPTVAFADQLQQSGHLQIRTGHDQPTRVAGLSGSKYSADRWDRPRANQFLHLRL